MDSFPVLSQAKSAFQAICGDTEGARRTQEKFLKTCPIVSQGTSAVQYMMGDEKGALETQKEFVEAVNDAVDSTPVVGHVKGSLHYAFGDAEGGAKAMKRASKGGLVLGGSMAGLVIGGPVGAIAGGIATDVALDKLSTESVVLTEVHASSSIAAVDASTKEDSDSISDDVFDLSKKETKMAPEFHPGSLRQKDHSVVDHRELCIPVVPYMNPEPASPRDIDFLVIGVTAGGLASANRAAQLGCKVALVGNKDRQSFSELHGSVSYYHGLVLFEEANCITVGDSLLKAKVILLAFDIKVNDISLGWTQVGKDSYGNETTECDFETCAFRIFALDGLTGESMCDEDAAAAGVSLTESLFEGGACL